MNYNLYLTFLKYVGKNCRWKRSRIHKRAIIGLTELIGAFSNRERDLEQGVVPFVLFLHPSGLLRATEGSCCCGRAAHPTYTLLAQPAEHREQNRAP